MVDKDVDDPLQDLQAEDTLEAEDKPSTEKMLSESRVTELIKKAKNNGEKKMQKQLDEAMQEIERLRSQQQNQVGMGNMAPQFDEEKMASQIMEKLQSRMNEDRARQEKERLEHQANEAANAYFSKMAHGRDKYDDFDAITAEFDAQAFPQLVLLATEAENTPAIIYELSKNPAKLATLATLVRESPNMARREIAKLSQSIKANEQAASEEKDTQPPLSRLKPSASGTGGEPKTTADFKRASWLKA